MISTVEPIDQVRAWKDEDYREQLDGELLDHPAGTIDLSPANAAPQHLNENPTITFITCDYDFCVSLVNNCFSIAPMICSTRICENELAQSRF